MIREGGGNEEGAEETKLVKLVAICPEKRQFTAVYAKHAESDSSCPA
jgi:hypothetical protein